MLARIDIGSIITVAAVALSIVAMLFAKRGSKRFRDWLEVRDGKVVLKDEIRLKLARNPARLRRVEALVARSYAVNEQGEIVDRHAAAASEAAQPIPQPATPAPATPAPVAPAPARPRPKKEAGSLVWKKADVDTILGRQRDKD
ncbi:MAG: hypothetical protein WBQ14_11560 [Gaiellaceae bacterium]